MSTSRKGKEQKRTGIDFLKGKKKSALDAITEGEPVLNLPLDSIFPDKAQPRQTFHQDESMVPQDEKQELQNLASSIKASGVIQPILVTKIADDKYQIVVGERRWRASRLAGKDTVPAIVKQELNDLEKRLIQLAENLQHENPSDYDTAMFIKGMLEEHPELKKSTLASIINKNNSYVSKMLAFISPAHVDLTQTGIIRNASVLEQFRSLSEEDQEELKDKAEKSGNHITATAVQEKKRQALEKQKPSVSSGEAADFDDGQPDDGYQRKPNEIIRTDEIKVIHDTGGNEVVFTLPTSISDIPMDDITDSTQQEVRLTIQQVLRVCEEYGNLDKNTTVTIPMTIGAMKEIITLLDGTVPDDPAMISFAFARTV